MLFNVGFELDSNQLLIYALRDAKNSFEDEFACADSFMRSCLQLRGRRKENYVGDAHTVDGCYKGYSDATPDLIDIGEVLHHLNKSQDRPDDPDSRRITSSCFVDFGLGVRILLKQPDLELHDVPDFGRFDAVNSEVQRLLEKRVLYGSGLRLKRHYSVLARQSGKFDDLFDRVPYGFGLGKKDVSKLL